MISTSTLVVLHATSAPHWHTFEIAGWLITFALVLGGWAVGPKVAARLKSTERA